MEKPRDIFVLQLADVVIWLVTGDLAARGAAVAWTRWSHLAAPILLTASVSIAGASVVVAATGARWVALTPATPN